MRREITDAILRDFLLGKVDDEDRDEIERLFLTDPHTKEKIFTAEEDLIEDYLENNLTTTEREEFLLRFAQTAPERRELLITKSLKGWAGRKEGKLLPSRSSGWAGLTFRLRSKPLVLVPITVTLIIAIVLSVIWLLHEQRIRRRMQVEQALAELNAPANLVILPPHTISLTLSPLTIRSEEQQIEFKPNQDIQILELHLPWIQRERYSTYQLELRRVADEESFMIQNLQTDDRSNIRVRIPADLLKRGQYKVQLKGVSSDGSLSATEDYLFTVTR